MVLLEAKAIILKYRRCHFWLPILRPHPLRPWQGLAARGAAGDMASRPNRRQSRRARADADDDEADLARYLGELPQRSREASSPEPGSTKRRRLVPETVSRMASRAPLLSPYTDTDRGDSSRAGSYVGSHVSDRDRIRDSEDNGASRLITPSGTDSTAGVPATGQKSTPDSLENTGKHDESGADHNDSLGNRQPDSDDGGSLGEDGDDDSSVSKDGDVEEDTRRPAS